MKKCHYCDNESVQTLVWLQDKNGDPAQIRLPWCGCDLMTALKKFWSHPFPVREGTHYRIENSSS